jgi:cation transport ATPase
MMDKKEAEKSLEEIKKHLSETEEDMRKMGVYAVDIHFLWGIFALIGLGLSKFFHGLGLYNLIWLSWALIVCVCTFFGYGIAKRIARMTGITSFAAKLTCMVWVGITISIALAMFILWVTEYTHFLESVIALFIGVGFFVEAFVTLRGFIAAAILCWLGAILVGLFPHLVNLVFSVLIFITMIVPAVVVKIRSRGK